MTSPVSFSRVPDGMPVAAAARRQAAVARLLRSPPAGGADLARASPAEETPEVDAGPPRAAAVAKAGSGSVKHQPVSVTALASQGAHLLVRTT